MAEFDLKNDFLGRGWSFPPSFDTYGQARMVTAEEDIRQSLYLLLETRLGERVFLPDYGAGLQGMVFEELTLSTTTEIRDLLERAVLFYEPRIVLERVEVDYENPEEGRVLISLEYRVVQTNNRANVVFPFYLREGTNVEI